MDILAAAALTSTSSIIGISMHLLRTPADIGADSPLQLDEGHPMLQWRNSLFRLTCRGLMTTFPAAQRCSSTADETLYSRLGEEGMNDI